jgi:hypothetical protein
MARILDDEQILETAVQEHLQSALGDYSEMLGRSPTFVLYYNKRVSASSSDVNLDTVYQVVGSSSPIRYNKIDNFPLYDIEQLSLDLSEGNFGPEAEVTSTGVVLPGTVVPMVDDMVAVPYFDSGVKKHAMFQVTNVSRSILGSKRFFKLNLDLTTKSVELADEQVEEDYEFSVSDYESNQTSILVRDDAVLLQMCRTVRGKVAEEYLQKFYDRQTSSLAVRLQGGGLLVNPHLHEFVTSNKIFKFQRAFYESLVYLHVSISNSLLVDETYKHLPYAAFEAGSAEGLRGSSFTVTTAKSDPLYMAFPADYRMTWHDISGDPPPGSVYYGAEDFAQRLKDGVVLGTEGMALQDFVVRYLGEVGDASAMVREADSLEMGRDLESFLLFPFVAFKLRKEEERLTKKTNALQSS